MAGLAVVDGVRALEEVGVPDRQNHVLVLSGQGGAGKLPDPVGGEGRDSIGWILALVLVQESCMEYMYLV